MAFDELGQAVTCDEKWWHPACAQWLTTGPRRSGSISSQGNISCAFTMPSDVHARLEDGVVQEHRVDRLADLVDAAEPAE